MEFVAAQDIEAPIAFVFQQVTDFAGFERQAMRHGADVRRLDDQPRPGQGSAWEVQFRFRGRDRRMRAEIDAFVPPQSLGITATSATLGGTLRVDLVALAQGRTRMTVTLVLTAHSLPARLMLQSLRLARGNLNGRFKARVTAFASEVQGRHARRPGRTT